MAHNGPEDSKSDDDSDSISSLSGDSVSTNYDGSNTDCGKSDIEDSVVPTTITDKNEIENNKKIAAFVKKVMYNEVLNKKSEWHLCLLNRSVNISLQELQNMILKKSAEVMTMHGKSHIAGQLSNILAYKARQRLYFKKFKKLFSRINTVSSRLELLDRVPKDKVQYVRNVGTDVKFPPKNKNCSVHCRY
ncbi:uncharacterized protein LOC100571315 [Acyrthosiphon pisum]|uniref:Uncharacterized protein n=1 Tax=Acyrthosiphon pisum TaxID=7029 RepID=A0A8R1W585_ACYPI|nr:uncharacterized protein LOC100571315 [Acyrthosiphon pisum]|eukprot:XP_003242185.1 PREDICTED: uncharacterized protein LOC100571315 [Acyrthosiphon pisum]